MPIIISITVNLFLEQTKNTKYILSSDVLPPHLTLDLKFLRFPNFSYGDYEAMLYALFEYLMRSGMKWNSVE